MTGIVVGVSLSAGHSFSKSGCDRIRLLEGVGVEGGAERVNDIETAG